MDGDRGGEEERGVYWGGARDFRERWELGVRPVHVHEPGLMASTADVSPLLAWSPVDGPKNSAASAADMPSQ